MPTNAALQFLGVGNAFAVHLGSASAALEIDGTPILMIDCGQEALSAYLERYGELPQAIFVTHAHLDHVAGFERLYYKAFFDPEHCGKLRVYCAAALVPILQARIADYPSPLAEGGANFWDAFQLVPVSRGFWHAHFWFDVFPVRHHLPSTAFGLALRGSLVWTGDTRPIPEMLKRFANNNELIAHDCGLTGNPSHTGLDDMLREYDNALRSRMIAYHYASAEDGEQIAMAGLRVAHPGDRVELNYPMEARIACALAWADRSV